MKSALYLCTAVAVVTLSAIGSESIQHVPKWVDEAKLAYAAEVKSSLPPLPVVSTSTLVSSFPVLHDSSTDQGFERSVC